MVTQAWGDRREPEFVRPFDDRGLASRLRRRLGSFAGSDREHAGTAKWHSTDVPVAENPDEVRDMARRPTGGRQTTAGLARNRKATAGLGAGLTSRGLAVMRAFHDARRYAPGFVVSCGILPEVSESATERLHSIVRDVSARHLDGAATCCHYKKYCARFSQSNGPHRAPSHGADGLRSHGGLSLRARGRLWRFRRFLTSSTEAAAAKRLR